MSGRKIIEGLREAIAYVKGDRPAGRVRRSAPAPMAGRRREFDWARPITRAEVDRRLSKLRHL